MKFDDLKWAVGTFVSALRDPKAAAHIDCECHPKLGYAGPRSVKLGYAGPRSVKTQGIGAPESRDDGAQDDSVRSGRSEAGSER